MTFIDKPMKASDYEEAELRFPYLASFKLDGYRAFGYQSRIRTSSGTPVMNRHTQALFSGPQFEGLDGELIVGAWNDPNAFWNTSGPVRRGHDEPDVRWYIFDDRTSPDLPFKHRLNSAKTRVEMIGDPRIIVIPHVYVNNIAEMEEFERIAVDDRFEGIMLRDPEGRYKYGRSTVKENLLLKVKRFITEEATITALEEQIENLTTSVPDALGRAKKSTSKDLQAGTGMVGAFIVESSRWPKPFRISASSLGHKARQHAWENPHEYVHQLARFKYFPHGVVDVPRHGVFEALRGREDL
jgi:DNA ligase 1